MASVAALAEALVETRRTPCLLWIQLARWKHLLWLTKWHHHLPRGVSLAPLWLSVQMKPSIAVTMTISPARWKKTNASLKPLPESTSKSLTTRTKTWTSLTMLSWKLTRPKWRKASLKMPSKRAIQASNMTNASISNTTLMLRPTIAGMKAMMRASK